MLRSIQVIDNFCPVVEKVRASAIAAGFGTWKPNKGYVGTSVYEGMGFWGDHAHMLASLRVSAGDMVPNSMFFRVTRPGMERAYIHSDRETGGYTCVAYLSEHDEAYGTAFYKHRATGLTEMPTFAEMRSTDEYDQLRKDMVEGGEDEWEQLSFVRGKFNRAVIFHAPLFHARLPLEGLGSDDEDSRMVWACHFHTPYTLSKIEENYHE